MKVAIDLLQALGGLLILGCCLLALEAMSRRTRHCFRLVYGLMAMAGLGLALAPFAAHYPWLEPSSHLTLILGAAGYLLLDRRRLDRNQQPWRRIG